MNNPVTLRFNSRWGWWEFGVPNVLHPVASEEATRAALAPWEGSERRGAVDAYHGVPRELVDALFTRSSE